MSVEPPTAAATYNVPDTAPGGGGMSTAVTTQPRPTGVQVRNMVESDSDFAGAMTVEAFESKFKWAVGESKYVNLCRFRCRFMSI